MVVQGRGSHVFSLLFGGVGSDGGRVGSNSGLESQLGLGFGSADEGLEDLLVGGFEDDVAACGVGEALKDSVLLRLDVEAVAKLINKHVGAEVLERELELLEAVVDRDLDGDGGIRTGGVAGVMAWSRHDGLCWKVFDRRMCGTRVSPRWR